jgi:hypothetical protein
VLRPPPIGLDTSEEEVKYEGILRALHLDKDWLEVIVSGETIRIDGVSETVDDIIGPMVIRPVIVHAKRKKAGGRPRFLDIEAGE